LAQGVLEDERLPKILAEDGLLVLGHSKRDNLEIPARWHEKKMLKHGDSVMRFFTRFEPPQRLPAAGDGSFAIPET